MGQSIRHTSQLLRMTAGVLVALLVLALAGLVTEGLHFLGSMSVDDVRMPLTRLMLLGFANLLLTAVSAMLGALYIWARVSRSLPNLKGWHVQMPESEFRAPHATDSFTLSDYCLREDRVFAELDSYIRDSWCQQGESKYSRYNPNSICYPDNVFEFNWNRTRVVETREPVGGVLLLHGLSDSPYSLRAIGERLHREGYTVVWLRLPGHGTTPRALAEISWKDWTAAVRTAACSLRQRVPKHLPLILAGYSNGGALSAYYALESIDNDELPSVDALVLFSPMIGINPLARITWFYHLAGLISRSEKSKWSSIFAEIDPFKYSSWPMNANVQAWTMTQAVERKLVALEKSGRMGQFPPVFAAQSVVDATVSVPKLITTLFDRLTSANSELFLFDVNRVDGLSNLLNLSFDKAVSPKLQRDDRSFRLSLLSNTNMESDQLSLKTRQHGRWTEQPLQATWPRGTVSLSHVAVPVPPSDTVYGQGSADDRLPLGTIQMRAEPNALMVPSSLFARSRHNPFYDFMEHRVINWLRESVVASETGETNDRTDSVSQRS